MAPNPPNFDVVIVGSAILDVIAHADDAFLADWALVKGSMALVDTERAEAIYAAMGPAVETSGGSAANTAVGVASFGGSAAFIGKVRDDQLGAVFVHDIRASKVFYDVPPAAAGPPTARCLILVTPDAQRTMNTNLGIAGELDSTDVDSSLVASGRVTYCEGYLWDVETAKAAIRTAMRTAKEADRLVALTLSDPFCVDRHRADFLDLVIGDVDILFANETEICSLYQVDDFDDALQAVRRHCELAFLTRGALGSVVVAGGDVHVIDAAPVDEVVDTTGAGDQYAAGALYAFTHGLDVASAGRLGSLAAAEVISHIGPRPLVPLSDLLGAV
jgi:sugar/nucleoside kinase (ribokinase family)